MLTASALTASASATHDRLGGAGRWLLALPAHHVAGLQVLVRSVLAGITPVAISREFLCGGAGFSCRLPGFRAPVVSLVAAQLDKSLGDPSASAALASNGCRADRRRTDAGRRRRKGSGRRHSGDPDVRDERDGGRVRVRRRPLDGVLVRIDPDGRIALGGATLASSGLRVLLYPLARVAPPRAIRPSGSIRTSTPSSATAVVDAPARRLAHAVCPDVPESCVAAAFSRQCARASGRLRSGWHPVRSECSGMPDGSGERLVQLRSHQRRVPGTGTHRRNRCGQFGTSNRG